MSNDLMPCPFCGSKNLAAYDEWVECRSCDAEGPVCRNDENPFDKWNTRTTPAAQAAKYPNRLCHLDYTAHPYRCGCLKGDDEAQRLYDEHCLSADQAVDEDAERAAYEAASHALADANGRTYQPHYFQRSSHMVGDYLNPMAQKGWWAWKARAAVAAPVQREQEPIGWFTDDHLADKSATTYDKAVMVHWVAKGWTVTPIYAAPVRAVRLPPRREPVGGRPGGGYSFIQAKKDIEWNACLDAVAQLNQSPNQKEITE